MKTTTEQIETKQLHTRTTFTCEHEGCTFSTFSESEAKKHEAYTHALAEQRETEAGTFYRFDSEANYRSFCKNTFYRYGGWGGPGWYGIEQFEDYCMGCSMGTAERLVPAREILQETTEKRDEANKKIHAIETLLGQNDGPKCPTCGLILTDPDDLAAERPSHAHEGLCIAAQREEIDRLTGRQS